MKPFETRVVTRCMNEDARTFHATCLKIGITQSELLRECIRAINTGRLRISPTEDQSVTIKGIHDA